MTHVTSVPVSPMVARRTAGRIVRTLTRAGHQALWAGGCVRDQLLKRAPTDYDIATSARPEHVRSLFKKTVAVGAKFGVILVIEQGRHFEVATFRSDDVYVDGRRPKKVHFSDARSDAERRDFTINGIFYDPIARRVVDYVDGRGDLRRRLIRTIGNPHERFEEDKLRILRALRFSVHLGFKIEEKTWTALRQRAQEIRQVSMERIRDELAKMLTGPKPGEALRILDRAGLLPVLLPEVEKLKGVAQPPEFHPEGDVFVHTCLMLDQLRNPSPILAFAALLHDIGKPDTFQKLDRIRFNNHQHVGARIAREVCKRLVFPNEWTDPVVGCVENHMYFKDAKRLRPAKLKRFLARATFITELEQHRADCLASHGDLSIWRFLKRKQRQMSAQSLAPVPLINGHDLLRWGYPQGPLIGKILFAAKEQQLENRIRSRDRMLAWVRRRFRVSLKGARKGRS